MTLDKKKPINTPNHVNDNETKQNKTSLNAATLLL